MASWNSKRTCTRTLGETAGGRDFHKYPPKTECGCLHGGVIGNRRTRNHPLTLCSVLVLEHVRMWVHIPGDPQSVNSAEGQRYKNNFSQFRFRPVTCQSDSPSIACFLALLCKMSDGSVHRLGSLQNRSPKTVCAGCTNVRRTLSL